MDGSIVVDYLFWGGVAAGCFFLCVQVVHSYHETKRDQQEALIRAVNGYTVEGCAIPEPAVFHRHGWRPWHSGNSHQRRVGRRADERAAA